MANQGDTTGKPRSAVETLLAYRKGKRRVVGGFALFLGMPLICFLLIGTGLPTPFVVLGFILAVLTGLIWMALPVLLGIATVLGLGKVMKDNMTQTFGAQGIFVPPASQQPDTSSAPANALAFVSSSPAVSPTTEATPGETTHRADLAAVTAELDLVRRDIAEKRKVALGKPVALVAAFSFGLPLLFVVLNGGREWQVIPIFGIIATTASWFLISQVYERQFAASFKDKLLPMMLARHGEIQRRPDYDPALGRGAEVGTIWPHTKAIVDDGFIGTYRGHRVAIADIALHRISGSGKKKKTRSRRVLTISVTLDGAVPATTVVTEGSPIEDGMRNRDSALQKVRLEDVVFEKVYDIFSTDQVGARAVLTPAVMERMLKMSDAGGFLPPLLLAEDDMLQFAVYTVGDRDLFEPLSVADQNIAGHLEKLETDLAQVFGLVDTVIDVGVAVPEPSQPPVHLNPEPEEMTAVLIVIAVAVVIIGGLYFWYVTIVSGRNKVLEALGTIDAQLQQRHDLIPNILAIARRFMEHEKSLLEEITALRAKAQPQLGQRDFGKIGDKFETEAVLGADMGRLFALAENYPELTSAGPMLEAQRSYTEVETNIAAARRFYNSAVTSLTNAVQIFPGPLVAGLAGVRDLPPFYKATEAAAKPINAIDHL